MTLGKRVGIGLEVRLGNVISVLELHCASLSEVRHPEEVRPVVMVMTVIQCCQDRGGVASGPFHLHH